MGRLPPMMVGSTASPVPALSRATPLPFTGHPIVISVHLYIRAALQEVGRLGAGDHLRAVLAAVATECGRLAIGPGRKKRGRLGHGSLRLRARAAQMLPKPDGTENNSNWHDLAHDSA